MFIRWANAPGIVTVFYRTTLSTILVAPFFVKNLIQNKQSLKSISPWLPMAMLGGLMIALDQASWASALLMAKMANTTYF